MLLDTIGDATEARLVKDTTVALRGGTDFVLEQLKHSIHNVLHLRKVYPVASFRKTKQHGVAMVAAIDPDLTSYVETVLEALHEWLKHDTRQMAVLVISAKATGVIYERWIFSLHVVAGEESSKEKRAQFTSVLRQVAAAIRFMPATDVPCAFDLHVHVEPQASGDENQRQNVPTTPVRAKTPAAASKRLKTPLPPTPPAGARLGTSPTTAEDEAKPMPLLGATKSKYWSTDALGTSVGLLAGLLIATSAWLLARRALL